MSAVVPMFPAPLWADPTRSDAENDPTGAWVIWKGANLASDSEVDVYLSKWMGYEAREERYDVDLALEVRISGQGNPLVVPSIENARALVFALTAAIPEWEKALAEGSETDA